RVSARYKPGRNAAALRHRRVGRQRARQLPRARQPHDRRSAVCGGKAAFWRRFAKTGADHPNRRKARHMSAPDSDKKLAEELRLRPDRPPVTRLSRRVLVTLAGVSSAVVLGAILWALHERGRGGDVVTFGGGQNGQEGQGPAPPRPWNG